MNDVKANVNANSTRDQSKKGPPSIRGRTFLSRPESSRLVSAKLEGAFCGPVVPGTGDCPIVGPDVLQLSISNEVGRSTLFVFAVGFDMDGPFRRIQRNDFERIGIGTWIHDAGYGLTVPLHLDCEVVPLSRIRTPVAVPNTGQRVALLGKSC